MDSQWGAQPIDSLVLPPLWSNCRIHALSDWAWQGYWDWTLFIQHGISSMGNSLRDHSLAWPKFSQNCEVVWSSLFLILPSLSPFRGVMIWEFFLLTSSPLSLTGIFPNKPLTCLSMVSASQRNQTITLWSWICSFSYEGQYWGYWLCLNGILKFDNWCHNNANFLIFNSCKSFFLR